ncbi:MAG: EF2563 family selenium-dependent molybdenum hydroxylase system protein [Anaerolineae bacterium]|nr:EF2563 family selenium-dependent molybdenum hydroxylase system protein [Anaerolineae bacterium]
MVSAFFKHTLVVVRGGGDLGSGAIYRLHRAGFPVIVLELSAPLLVRRAVAFGDAAVSGVRTVEGVTARRIASRAQVDDVISAGEIPVLIDPEGEAIPALKPVVILDARMEKRNPGTTMGDAPLVVALGPGFTAGVDCHAVVETNRGHNLGRAIYSGAAESDTGEPGSVQGQTFSRILRAPADGCVEPHAEIGDVIAAGQVIAHVAGQPVTAAFAGVLRGLVHERLPVTAGLKIGDLDPRARREHCFTISDKSLAVGGGVLEAVFSSDAVRNSLNGAS